MPSLSTIPVIVLAYANERTSKGFLRELNNEMKGTLRALEPAVQEEQLFTKIIPSATQGEIAQVFQDTWYEGRVEIFHYAGHADDDELWLEKEDGGNQAMFSIGLAKFLGAQKSIKLVFLNGCATLDHAQLLLDANIPAVIATSRVINDTQARKFSAIFYQGLSSGATIQEAFDEAEGLLLAEYGPTGLPVEESGAATRSLFWEDQAQDAEQAKPSFPWRLFLRKNEGWIAGDWRLFTQNFSGSGSFNVDAEAFLDKTVGNYKIQKFLGQGSLGLVYKAVHLSLGTEVAMKITYPAREGFERLKQIIIGGNKGLSSISHPNIVKFIDIRDINLFGQRLYIVMEFVKGQSLDKLNFGISGMRREAIEDLVDFGIQLCKAVQAVHETQFEDENGVVREGFVHGNIKRRKIIVTPDNIPKLTDFMFTNIKKHGQVKLEVPEEVLSRERSEKLHDYYPPEVISGESQVNKQTDIYSLGAVFLEVILNRRLSDVRFSTDDELHDIFSAQNKRFPKKLTKVIFKSLHPNPKHRYAKMSEMIEDMEQNQSSLKRFWHRITNR